MNPITEVDTDSLVLQKLANEAFDMMLSGDIDQADKVFTAIDLIRPGNRPSALGLAITEMLRSRVCRELGMPTAELSDDPILCCFIGLEWLQQGRTADARAILESVSVSGEIVSARLARNIMTYELDRG
ncbi:hypothetical protein BTA51_04940 [Hahella sp. CCB-MM4]|uniref:hypothetical protein n=1 Tax=Hahella sp. (strain CCB-MM4) TaxID=1926491 RepID=UPI000B9B1D8B|nr:hypothetical protein [Hahella sp. CCB-MM4]OZG74360.1 hypothetical protein BTA51_04940 [Hahella sp. CCB-MM4]